MNLDDLTAPHCDPAVLHALGECVYCDEQPEWQALRELWGICFTGQEPDSDHPIPCPSDLRRPGRIADLWPGNQARP